MEPSKAAMKAALRVLTALSDRLEPHQADVDELHWYAPSDRQRPLDEVVCDAIQRALKEREDGRKATQARLRETALAFQQPDEPIADGSGSQRDREIQRLLRQHRVRQQEYSLVCARVKRLGAVLQQAGANLAATDPSEYTGSTEAAAKLLASLAGEADLGSITQLLAEYVRLTTLLQAGQQALQALGIET